MRRLKHALKVAMALSLGNAVGVAAEGPDGSALYKQLCATCHETSAGRAPAMATLSELPPETIVLTLMNGSMRFVGGQMRAADREAVARFISRRGDELEVEVSGGLCDQQSPLTNPLDEPRWIGWGADLQNTRFQPGEMAGLGANDVPRLKLEWAFGFPGVNMAWAQPTVAGGRVFVGSARGDVYSLDATNGCTHWSYAAQGPVRTAIAIGRLPGQGRARHAAYFADWQGSVYAVDAETGAEIWRTRVEEHPATRITSSPTLHKGRLYVGVSSFEENTGALPEYECCTFRGSVVALDARSGQQIWKTYTVAEPMRTRKNKKEVQLWGPSGVGVWTSPTIDAKLDRVYVTTGDNYSDPATDSSDAMLALALETGEIVWSRQFTKGDAYTVACVPGRDPTNCPEAQGPDFDFGSSPQLVSLPGGRRLLLAGQKSGWVHAVDPDRDGEIVWQYRASWGGALGGIQWGPAVDAEKIYVALSDIKFRAILDSSGEVQRGVNPHAGGGLMAFDVATGERRWFAPGFDCADRPRCSPGQSAAVTLIPGVVFSGSLDGHLRAYSTADGSVLWDVDTVRDYETVNGVTGRGGAINGPGPVVVDGMLFVNSGYGQFGTMPGNVLLAFSVEDE